MADDIKSLGTRVQKLETMVNGRTKTLEELERKGKYLEGILDTQNKLLTRMEAAETRLDALSKRVTGLGNKG